MASRPPSRTQSIENVAAAASRTTRARTVAAKATPTIAPTATAKRIITRKPLTNRDKGENKITKATAKTATSQKAGKTGNGNADAEREPIMAYLRIRPQLGDEVPMMQPYLTALSNTTVRMTDPNDPQSRPSIFRSSALPPSSNYTFSHVFPPDTNQSDFFTKTTLPLVSDLLQGQNGLLFTYGVTNSGKTYTIQGGKDEGRAGILPRTLDVIFNSIDGLHGSGKFRPVRLYGIEPADPSDSRPPQIAAEPALSAVLGPQADDTHNVSADSTSIKLDRNYEFTVYISYAEVYNEKVYDLLDSLNDESDFNAMHMKGAKSLVLARTALPLKPSPPSDNEDLDFQGKYIAGLRQFRVHSASEAKAIIKLGQLHRRVFGTLANRESSRSHGMVIIKVVKGHRGEKDDPTSLQISRLTLVDLAGSERTKHTHTTGDRLREAGNINKSLMVLGQCMEVLRSNQRKLAMSLANIARPDGRMDTRDVKKTLAIVPFRHSKLTEALMDYFVGDGKVVMIVNINPYDTGYDENSHVMRFAALAREVYVTPTPAPVHRFPTTVPRGPGKLVGNTIKELGPMALNDPDIIPKPYRRKVTISMDSSGGPGRQEPIKETVLEIMEVDEPAEDNSVDSEGPFNPLVDALFDEIEDLRMQLFESEMRCALIEAEIREEVMQEMEERMKKMEAMYMRRMANELEQQEIKTDAKIDMLHQAGIFSSPTKPTRYAPDLSVVQDVDVESDLSPLSSSEDEANPTPTSPMAGRSKGPTKQLIDSDEDDEEVDKDVIHDDSDDDAWEPPKSTSATGKRQATRSSSNHKDGRVRAAPVKKSTRVSELAKGVQEMKIEAKPNPGGVGEDSEDEVPVVKKKKRILGKNRIMTEDQIEQEHLAMEHGVRRHSATRYSAGRY